VDLTRRIFDDSNAAMLFSDVDGVIRLWNRAAEDLLG
jgi:PAS domain S-box-containing protein